MPVQLLKDVGTKQVADLYNTICICVDTTAVKYLYCVVLAKYHSGDQRKGTCSTHRRHEKCKQSLNMNTKREMSRYDEGIIQLLLLIFLTLSTDLCSGNWVCFRPHLKRWVVQMKFLKRCSFSQH